MYTNQAYAYILYTRLCIYTYAYVRICIRVYAYWADANYTYWADANYTYILVQIYLSCTVHLHVVAKNELQCRVLPKIWSRGRVALSRWRTMPIKRHGVVLAEPHGGGGDDRNLLLGGPEASPGKFWNWGSKKCISVYFQQSWFCSFLKEKQFHREKHTCDVMC